MSGKVSQHFFGVRTAVNGEKNLHEVAPKKSRQFTQAAGPQLA
jgi:hypothetical protein